MPSHRVTDTAHIAPYLTHAISHHGQVTLVPPDNAGRVRQAKPKKNRSRQRQDRSVRSEEDMKFNTGPRPLRNLVSNGRGRRPTRQDPSGDEAYTDEGYPNYPPPSFQEATSMPSSPHSNATEVPQLTSSPYNIPASQNPPLSPLPPQSSPPMQPQNVRPNAEDGESETSSLEIIELQSSRVKSNINLPCGKQLEDNVKRDWRSRRGVEFPIPEGDIRGRSKNRNRVILPDSDSEDTESHSKPVESTQKRKNMSLSPLHTLFPSRTMNLQERPFSAHETSSNFPYSSRSTIPFLSTTSLKLSTTSFAPSPKGEGFFSRKLLSLKGKEKDKEHDKEPLENWEVIEAEPHPPSLMTALEPLNDNPHPSSPTRSVSYTYGSPSSTRLPMATSVESSASTPHLPPLRDKKIPLVHSKRPNRPAPSTMPRTSIPVPVEPVVTSVRTRKPPLLVRRPPQVVSSSPLGQDSWRPASLSIDSDLRATLQRALVTPLPPTPIDGRLIDSIPSSPNTSGFSEVLVPGYHPTPAAEASAYAQSIESGLEQIVDANFPDYTLESRTGSVEELTPSVRRHYRGRPLPQTPGAPSTVTNIACCHNNDSFEAHTAPQCPEGLLIDLEDDPPDDKSSANVSKGNMASLSYPSSSNTSSVDLLGSLTDTESVTTSQQQSSVSLPQVNTSRPQNNVAQVAQTSAQPAREFAPPGFSEITDLDVLFSRIGDEEQRDGMNYENLLLLSEFIGPAASAASASPSVSVYKPLAQNVPLISNIQVARRRTTKDGRIKLKLVLIDASVNQCTICLTQFRSGDLAQLGSVCRHAFHEKCLARWLARSKTCPLCRVPLSAFL